MSRNDFNSIGKGGFMPPPPPPPMPGFFSISRQASSNGPSSATYPAENISPAASDPHRRSSYLNNHSSSPLHTNEMGSAAPNVSLDHYFDLAVRIVQSFSDSGIIQSSYDDKLLLYGLYKQATEGDVRAARPGLLDVLGRAKWTAWKRHQGVEMEEAKDEYVRAVKKILSEHLDQPSLAKQAHQLAGYQPHRRGVIVENGSRPRRRNSASSSSSSRSFVSSRESPLDEGEAEDQLDFLGGGSNTVEAREDDQGNHQVTRMSSVNDMAFEKHSARGRHSGPHDEGHFRRRDHGANGSDSDSSISLGGDAQSHHASRAGSLVGLNAGERKRRRGEAVKRRRGLEQAPTPMTMTAVHPAVASSSGAAAAAAARLGQPNHLPLGYRPGSTPHLPSAAAARGTGTTTTTSHHQFHPGVAPSPVPSLGQFSAPYASPFLTAARLRAGLHASPNPSSIGQGSTMMPMAPQVYPPPVMPPAPQGSSYSPGAYDVNLPLALEQIQTSLTALHERIIALEHSQAIMLAQPADPWTTLMRWFATAIGSNKGDDEGQHGGGGDVDAYAPPGLVQDDHRRRTNSHKRHRLPLRIILRLLGTLRRTMVDVTFVLVVMSLGVAIWAGVKGRGRGGRRALMQFWATTLRRGRMMYRNAFDRLIEP